METRQSAVIVVCGLISALLAGMVTSHVRVSSGDESDILLRLFGGTAEIASQSAVNEADVFLHAGVGHTSEQVQDQSVRHASALPLQGLIISLHDSTTPSEHKHVRGEEEKEVLPWFVIAARLNPHNVEAWLDGTYWYYRTGKTDEAERFISRGILKNPTDHRVYLERGVLYHRLRRWHDAAADLEACIHHYRKLNDESPFELRAARTYLRDSLKRLR